MAEEVVEEVAVFVERGVRDRRRVECNRDEIICRRTLPDRRGNPHHDRVSWWRGAGPLEPEGERRNRAL